MPDPITTTETPETPAASTEQATTTTTQAPPAEQPPAEQPPAADTGRVEDLPQWAQDIVRNARSEAAKDRTNAKSKAAQEAADKARQDLAQQVGKALGLITDDEPVDADKLTADLQAAQAAQRDTAIELALFKAAPADVDATRLLDSRAFMASIPTDLDPADGDAVKALVDAAVEANPLLRTTTGQVPGSSTTQHAGGSGEGAITKADFDAMTGAERNRLLNTNPTLYNRLTGRE